MKIGIMIHSHSGNTLHVAQRIKEALVKAGHVAEIEQIKSVNEDPADRGNIELKSAPEITAYDLLIFGAPVWAFSLSSVMKVYLSQIAPIGDKKAAGFVTQHLSHAWMGGNRAVGQMKKICAGKGAKLLATGIINWNSEAKQEQIKQLIEKLCAL